MKKIYILPLFLLGLLFSTACKKHKAPYTILSATYEFTDLNDCTFENNSNETGSSLTLNLKCDDFITSDIYGIRYKRKWSNGEKDKEFTLLRSIDLFLFDKEITTNRCVKFATNIWIDYELQLIMNNGDLSKPFILKVDRPAGAN